MHDARRDRRRRRLWTLAACTVLLWGVLWIVGDIVAPVLGETWIAELEMGLSEKGCPSSLGNVLSLRPWSGITLGPVALCSRPYGPALFRADQLQVMPYWKSLLRGKPALRKLTASQVLLDGDRVWELAQRAATKQGVGGPTVSAEGMQVRLEGVRVLTHGHVLGGPEVILDVARRPDGGRAQLLSGLDHVLEGKWSRSGGDTTAEMHLSLAHVAEWAELHWLREGIAHATLRPAAGSGRAEGSALLALELENVRIQGAPLSDVAVGPWSYGLEADVTWNGEGVEATRLTLGAGPKRLALAHGTAKLPWALEKEGNLSLALSEEPFGTWMAALPPELQAAPEVPRLDAPLYGTVKIAGPLGRPEGWDVQIALGLDGLRKAAKKAAWSLREPFTHAPRIGGKAEGRDIVVGPANPLFVPLAELPPHVVRAITLSEDAGFFAHSGFDFDELKKSVLDPVERRRHRGASTLTQQLAKNLFSSGERTYARKVREAMATITLEASLPKTRILELYTNLIEWGPDVFGIGEAAQHYFGVDPRKLTPKQAVFLATVIPNPVRYHVQFARGSLSDTWEERVNELLGKLRDTGVLTPASYEEARAAPMAFRPQGTPVRTAW